MPRTQVSVTTYAGLFYHLSMAPLPNKHACCSMFFLFRNLETESATPAAYAAKEPCLGVQRDLLSQAKSPSTDRSHQRLGGGGEGDLINRHYDDDVMWGVRLLRLVWWLGIVVGVPYLSSLDEVFPRMHTCSFFFSTTIHHYHSHACTYTHYFHT